jgi:hypothetical protein
MYYVGKGEFWGEDEAAGRYYGLDSWLTSKLGRWGFLAAGSLQRSARSR